MINEILIKKINSWLLDSFYSFVSNTCVYVHAVLDDDSSQLHEVLELFSDITLPIKVDRLMKVSEHLQLSL